MKVYAVPKYLFNAELAKIVARAIVLRLKGIQDKKRKAEEAWKEYIKIVTPHEDRFRRILKKLFKTQEQEVLRNMRRSSKSLVITKDKINTWLFDEKEWKEKFGQAEEDFLAGLATEVGNQTVESLPVVGMMFDVNNPNLRKRMDKRVGEFKGVVDTTTRKIRDSLTVGIDAGESIDELADRVINVFKDASYNRAEMIARTETIWGSNAATESTYMQSGVVEGKEWQVALDGRLCEFCMHMYEHYGPGKGGLGLGKRFFEQGDSLQVGEGESRSELVFNYEPIEHPPLHPRCRCVLVSRLSEFGKVVERDYVGELTKTQKEAIDFVTSEIVGRKEVVIGELLDYGLNREEIYQLAKKFSESSEVCINRVLESGSASLDDLYKTGKMKQQFELAAEGKEITTSGTLAPAKGMDRDLWEKDLFGSSFHRNPEYLRIESGKPLTVELAKERPYYGYVFQPKALDEEANCIEYGRISFVMKKEIKEVSTGTIMDSSGVSVVSGEAFTFKEPWNVLEELIDEYDIEEIREMIKSSSPIPALGGYEYNECQIFAKPDLSRNVQKIRVLVSSDLLEEYDDDLFSLISDTSEFQKAEELGEKWHLDVEYYLLDGEDSRVLKYIENSKKGSR